MKSRTILTLLFFIFYIFSPFGSFINFEKKYSYSSEQNSATLKLLPVYSQESSNFKYLKPKISYFSTNLNSNFSQKKDTIIFKISKDKIKDTSDINISLLNGSEKINISIDDDGDERILADAYYFTEPVFIDSTKNITYKIESKTDISGTEFSVIGVDTKSYDEKMQFSLPGINSTNANGINIVKRSEWGADESLRYESHPTWVSIYKKIATDAIKPKTAWQIKQEEKVKNIRSYLVIHFPEQDNPVQTIKSENGKSLVWNIEKTKKVEKIVVHHTAGEYSSDKDDASVIRGIYYYHTITRGWGDIGYNYLIGRDGKIYEGRAGGDYTVAAHTLWNNKSTVGISVLGNFQASEVPETQENGLKTAILYLAKKYGIDIDKESIAHKECSDQTKCLVSDYKVSNLIGHKDAGSTTCPGNNLYTDLAGIKFFNKKYTAGLTYIENPIKASLDKGSTIKIKLSFTGNIADIESYTAEKMKITLGKKSGFVSGKLSFEPKGTNQIRLIYKGKKFALPNLKITSTVLEVSNWSRIPSWDKEKRYNDNKFRGSIYIYNDNGVLTLVNELPVEDYLKGLAENSNDTNMEKLKTIIVSARSYATRYTSTENRKFPGKIYDGSDNPDEFQKYLGHSFEIRSPNVAKAVDETNSLVIKYDGKLVKPWYFNQSNGVTKSYQDYCEQRKTDGSLPKTTVCEDIPYLQSVVDPAGNSADGYKGHGVGLSGAGATYLAEKEGYKFDEIIKYFYTGVSVEKN